MDVELQEVFDFLAVTTPFDTVPLDVLRTIPQQCRIEYHRRDDVIIAAGTHNDYLRVIRSGSVDVIDDGTLVDRRDVGDSFGYGTLLRQDVDRFDLIAHEDTLVIAVPKAAFIQLTQASGDFERFYGKQYLRIRAASSSAHATPDNPQALSMSLGDVIGRSLITCTPQHSIREAAQIMAEHKVSALVALAEDESVAGIITDKDLRNKVVAPGKSIDDPVSSIMTEGVMTLGPDAAVLEAMLMMISHRFNHLPVTSEGKAIGLVSSGDIMRLQQANPIYVVGAIAKAQTVDQVAEVAKGLPKLVIQLVGANTDAQSVARVITATADSVTRRLIDLAIDEFGAPPVPYAWIACGSQGRRELGPSSDQDNGLVLANDVSAEHDEYFAKFAEFVCLGLEKAGQELCPGDVMATNKQWRQPQRVWMDYISNWLTQPDPEALLNAQIFFDMRCIAGDESLVTPLRQQISRQAPQATRALAHLARAAANRSTPIGFFKGFVLDQHGGTEKTLNLKHGGTAVVFELARLYALTAGVDEVGTLARLEKASAGGAVSKQGAENLAEAFVYLRQLLIEHQTEQLRKGEKPDTYLDPRQLSSLERHHLKDAFQIIGKVQKGLSVRYPLQAMS